MAAGPPTGPASTTTVFKKTGFAHETAPPAAHRLRHRRTKKP